MDLKLTRKEQAALTEAACRGDREAEKKILDHYQGAIFGCVRGWARQNADAEEIAQNVWLRVFGKGNRKYICRYDPCRGALYTFLRRIALSCTQDYYRKQGPEYLVDMLEMETLDFTRTEMEMSEAYEDEDLALLDEDLIKKLSSLIDRPVTSINELHQAYKVVLEILFQHGGYPHRVMAYAFNKLINNWKPKKIVEELSDIPLRELCQKLKQDYITESSLPEEEVISCFTVFEQKMDLLLGDVITDTVSRDRLRPILDKLVGKTIFKEYYGKNPSQSIPDWCYKVLHRVRRLIRN